MNKVFVSLIFLIIFNGCGNKVSFNVLYYDQLKEMSYFVKKYGEPKTDMEYYANKESQSIYNENAVLTVPAGFRKEIDKIKECKWKLSNSTVNVFFFKYNDKWIMYYGFEVDGVTM